MQYDEYRAQLNTTRTDHGEFAYLDVGDGPATVFVHGLFVSGFMWARGVVDALKDERRCVVYNLPGHGGSTVPDDQALTLEANAEMLEAFCASLGLDAIDLVANDTGGAIAQIVAAEHPERLARVVLTSCDLYDRFFPPLFQPLKTVAAIPGAIWLVAQTLRPRIAQRSPIAYGWLAKQLPDRQTMDAYLKPGLSNARVRRDLAKVLRGVDSRYTIEAAAKLRSFDKPVLLAWAKEDKLFPLDYARRLAGELPDATLVEIEDSYTFVPEDQPRALVEAITQFARRPAAVSA